MFFFPSAVFPFLYRCLPLPYSLSGLSPFMGHNYVETMTNVTHNKYDFDDEAFDTVSDEAKEFIQKLLVLDKR